MKKQKSKKGETFTVSGCGPDQTFIADSAEKAAQEAAEWFHAGKTVSLEWVGNGPDTALAEYRISLDGEERSGMGGLVTVRQ